MTTTASPPPPADATADQTGGGAPVVGEDHARGGHRHLSLAAVELLLILVALAFAAHEAPGFASSIASGFSRLRHPDLVGLGLGVALVLISFLALAEIPRVLLARCGVALGWIDAITLSVAANGMAVILPAGTVASSVWVAHQYSRRGARAVVATWVVLAAGFSSSVALIAVLISGAMIAGLTSEVLLGAVAVAFVTGTTAFVWLVHRAEQLPAQPGHRSFFARSGGKLARVVRETAGQRAGWSTGSAVLAVSAVNWLADAGCLASAFLLLRMPVPWRGVVLAYAAGQVAGALIPLPAGLGAVEGGIVGVLVGFGVGAGPALAVVAVYRLLGYWGPTLVSLPAYGWARRRVERPLAPGTLDPGGTHIPA
jgi:uncharacterized membrane protein YbhN (UPF0104 family)